MKTASRPQAPVINLPYAKQSSRADAQPLGRIFTLAGITWMCMLPVTMLVAPLKEIVRDAFNVGVIATHSFQSINMLGAFMLAPFIAKAAGRGGWLKTAAIIGLAADGVLFALMKFATSSEMLLAIRFFEGAAHIMALSSLMALVASYAPDDRRGRVMGIVGAAMMFGTACGTRLGGIVWTQVDTWIFIVGGGISTTAALLVLLFVPEQQVDNKSETPRRSWIALARERPALNIAYAYAFMDRFCVGVIISTFTLFLADVHQLTPDARSRMLVMFLAPFAVLVYPAGRLVDRIGRALPIAFASAGFGVVFALYGLLDIAWMPAAMVASGVLSALMFAPNLTLCADLAPEGHRGAAFTGFNAAGSLGFFLGPLVAGSTLWLMSEIGFDALASYRMAFVAAGAGEVLCAAITLPLLMNLRRQNITR